MLKKHYAIIILPLALAQDYTYEIPSALLSEIAIGKRVTVQFGQKKMYAGIVKKIYETDEPQKYKIKPILNILDEKPIVTPKQLKLWQWIATYYMCKEGEVMNVALPADLKLASKSKLLLHPSCKEDFSMLTDNEYLVAEALSIQKELTIEQVQQILDKKNVVSLIKSLLDKDIVLMKEELQYHYKPKTIKVIRLHEKYKTNEIALQELFAQLDKRKAHRQLSILMAYWQLWQSEKQEIWPRKTILAKAKAESSHLRSLLKKEIFVESEQQVSRLDDKYEDDILKYQLTSQQQYALDCIDESFEKKGVVLLHGITSSGKTQIYIKLIERIVANDEQALFLMPEIALTAQMINRLRQFFGEKVGIYHSKFNHLERVEIWEKVLRNEYKVVIGARSALFLPFQNLQLIIVDEEHDNSYKQFDPAPRYHARDTAIYLAALHGAKTVLGTGTPSLESYHNATISKKFGFVTMFQRYGGVQPPKIEIVNMYLAKRNQQVKSHYSDVLLNEIKIALANNEQAIIFQNRRGYSPYLACHDCEWIPKCFQCDVSLTYHKFNHELKCHYCGYRRKVMAKCDSCGSTHLEIHGFGTEKVEDELQDFFPKARIGRLDLEVARSKKAYEKVLQQFENRELDILVGTQMVTKGLDFANVSVVGVLSADQLLNFPDFRANERAFQLILQVSGRAGRRQKQGKVIIQSMNKDYKVLDYVLRSDYNNFFRNELTERRQFHYPPYVRLVQLNVRHADKDKVNKAAFLLTKNLKMQFGKQVLGPNVPYVSRVRGYHIRQIMIKLKKGTGKQLHQDKYFIKQHIDDLRKNVELRSVFVQIDVDTY